jgi:predicted MFS family arabinose efflux permease
MITNVQRIYFIRFCSNFCQAVFFPFFAVWLWKEKLFSSTEAAFIVSFGIFSTRLSAVLFSKLVNNYHKKYIIISSLLLISILYSFFYFFAVHDVSNFLAWVTLSILVGGSLSVNSLALLSYIAIHNDEKKHHAGFSVINIALNLSSGLGPFLGAITLSHHEKIFPLVPIAFSLLSVFTCFFLAKDSVTNKKIVSITKFHLGGNKFISFIILNILTFVGYAQFYDVFPIYAMRGMNEQTIGVLFIISSIIIVFVQMPMTKIIEKLSAETSIFISNLMLCVGTLLFIPAADNGFFICSLGVIVISLAEVMYAPLYQSIAIKLFEPNNPVLSLAIQSFSWGLAEAIATFVGIYTAGHGNGYISIMLGAMAALLVSGICFLNLKKAAMEQV